MKYLKFKDLQEGKVYKADCLQGLDSCTFLLLQINKYNFVKILTENGIESRKFSDQRRYYELSTT